MPTAKDEARRLLKALPNLPDDSKALLEDIEHQSPEVRRLLASLSEVFRCNSFGKQFLAGFNLANALYLKKETSVPAIDAIIDEVGETFEMLGYLEPPPYRNPVGRPPKSASSVYPEEHSLPPPPRVPVIETVATHVETVRSPKRQGSISPEAQMSARAKILERLKKSRISDEGLQQLVESWEQGKQEISHHA